MGGTLGDPVLAELGVGDAPEVWADLGFTVEDGAVVIGTVRITLAGNGTGLRTWAFDGLPPEVVEAGRIDGIRTGVAVAPGAAPTHPNGVSGIDHVVVFTGDHGRTLDAISAAGFDLRRGEVNTVDSYGAPMVQAFFRPPGGIIEVVGPKEADPNAGSARFFGLCFTSDDLDATAAFLGDRLKPAKDAVQPGRRIATLASSAGSAVPIAIMTPHIQPGTVEP